MKYINLIDHKMGRLFIRKKKGRSEEDKVAANFKSALNERVL